MSRNGDRWTKSNLCLFIWVLTEPALDAFRLLVGPSMSTCLLHEGSPKSRISILDSFSVLRPFNTFEVISGAVSYLNHTVPGLFLGKPPDSLPVISAHSSASNWQLLFLNQRKRENGRRNVFMTKSPRKNVPDVGTELRAACSQADTLPIEPPRPWICDCKFSKYDCLELVVQISLQG